MKRIAAAVALVAVGGFAAPAQQQGGPVIEGRWGFQTGEYVSFAACTMKGEVEIMRTETPGEYSCRMWTEETCPDAPLLITSEQVCAAARDGEGLEIRSTVVSFTPVGGAYVPDDFTLRIESSQRMSGHMHAPGEPEAIFRRLEELLS